ncbi:hypothetical protein KEI82_002437 [Staphylococcus pseudintermedius]|uniref:hypothetical protein n=1 Tax=Staphylococcus pseudintermedius TaxID=283734 RepID=UPI0018F5F57F|nr:hypothetical protein [Staphylococcus pseudintermedius]EGQ3151772.1 hypothetical protein [Staphylococcus pseudintermedius]EGQ3871464.1 hypothetical protein [Staphylococcus pseudintermedius]EHL7209581.1 hypothetical protein [Staphylococcus pseudintermedius]EIM5218839.1 hypothetical protein [Staphylococcus pseudintermedius]EIT0973756.1 hypothetical protein [Staphylococcus pseudintermedius]
MGIKVYGLDEIEKALDKRYSKQALNNTQERALKAGGNMLRNKTATALYNVRDTGQLAIGTDLKDPRKIGNEFIANLYWRGDHKSLAYINEHGYYDKSGKFVKPRGADKVNTTLKLNSDLYYSLIKKELDK